jgi:hypothetical protein
MIRSILRFCSQPYRQGYDDGYERGIRIGAAIARNPNGTFRKIPGSKTKKPKAAAIQPELPNLNTENQPSHALPE